MITKSSKRGFTLVELLVVIAIIGILIGVLLPAIQLAREAGRKTACKNNMSQIGKAILMYDEQKGQLPRSHRKPAGATGAMTESSYGWSWAFQITPMMERRDLYQLINTSEQEDNPDSASNEVKSVQAAEIPIFACPSFSSGKWVDSQGAGSRPEAKLADETNRCLISNYKVTCASTDNSRKTAYGGTAPSTYGTDHPDGAIAPNTTWPVDALSDGTSNTILVAECAERRCSRWVFGNEMEVIGLPDEPTGTQTGFLYYFPTGFKPEDPKFYDDTEIQTTDGDISSPPSGKPFAAYNYTGTENGATYSGKQGNNTNAYYGPSSDHPEAVNHLFGDTSIWSISKKVDAAAYLFMITRNGGDPAPPK